MQAGILSAVEYRDAIPRLGVILSDAVNSGAGVSFLLPFHDADGEAYWAEQAAAVDAGRKIVFTAHEDGVIAGTVSLERAWPPNQPHRGEISKMLVHRDFRRRGVGKLLLQALETEARRIGLTLLTFDTVADSPAEAFYRNLGFTCIGYIPDYALSPTGQLDATAIFFKKL
jgi:GNAT superfamily N-acetyltransferase